MTPTDRSRRRIDLDADLFKEAVTFTAAESGFDPRLIEKDYFATLLLGYLGAADAGLVFKGGTCLAKVHADFYRLSEDLDFVIPTPCNATRRQRSARAAPAKQAVAALAREVPGFRLAEPMTGASNSSQYLATTTYTSLLDSQAGVLKVEVGLREPLLEPVLRASVRTLLLDPVSGGPLLPPSVTPCISLTEAFAEKFRAALTRREPAIRDFYDIDYAVRSLNVQPQEPAFVDLVRRKLAVPGNAEVDASRKRLGELRLQREGRLRPVLRPRDFAEFDLDRAFGLVAAMAAAVAG